MAKKIRFGFDKDREIAYWRMTLSAVDSILNVTDLRETISWQWVCFNANDRLSWVLLVGQMMKERYIDDCGKYFFF